MRILTIIFGYTVPFVPAAVMLVWGLLFLTGKLKLNNATKTFRGRYLFSEDKDWRFDQITRLYGIALTAGGGIALLAGVLTVCDVRWASILWIFTVAWLLAVEIYRNVSHRFYW